MPGYDASKDFELEDYFSWGRLRKTSSVVQAPGSAAPLTFGTRPVLPHGLGRSYGDVATNDGGTLLSSKHLDNLLGFDPGSGLVRCQSGVSLADLLDVFLPKGFFIPVTLGTKFVTVGGAIANDVHGKNHHRAGTFGRHVASFRLLRSSGDILECSSTENPELYAATVGGLGLTGLILDADIRLARVPSGWVRGEMLAFNTLDEYFELSQASSGYGHTAGWVDLLNLDAFDLRGVFFRGDFALREDPLPRTLQVTLPFQMPRALLNRSLLKLFNRLYFASKTASPGPRWIDSGSFFFPLDGLGGWNRMYGARGFYQYQCVFPGAAALPGLRRLLAMLKNTRAESFLGVIKTFGDLASPGLLSFPRPGVTISIDLPGGPKALTLMNALDHLVFDFGGAVYPAKDARMRGPLFKAFFPGYERFKPHVDPLFSSDFWRRMHAE